MKQIISWAVRTGSTQKKELILKGVHVWLLTIKQLDEYIDEFYEYDEDERATRKLIMMIHFLVFRILVSINFLSLVGAFSLA